MNRPVPNDVRYAANTFRSFATRFAEEARGEKDIFVLLVERQGWIR